MKNEISAFIKKYQHYLLPVFILLLAYFACVAIGDEGDFNDPWGLILWVIAIVLTLHILVNFARLKMTSFPWREAFIFLALFLFAFVLRAFRVSDIPALLNGDESGSALDALNFLYGNRNNFLTTGWYSFPAMHPFIQSFFIGLFGRTPLGVRMSSVLIGSLTIPFTYLLVKRMFTEKVGLIAALLLSVLPLHNHMSRIGLNNIWDAFFFLLVLMFFWDGWKRQRPASYAAAGLALGFSQYFYATARTLIPITLVLFAVFALIDWPHTRAQLRLIGLMFLLAVVVMSPLYYHYALNPNEFTAPLNRVSALDPGWLANQKELGRSMVGVFFDQITTAIGGIITIPVKGYFEAGKPILSMPSALFFVLGIAALSISLIVKKFKEERFYLFLFWIGSVLATVFLSVDAPSAQRYVAALPAFAILSAYGLVELVHLFDEKIQVWLSRILVVLVLVMVVQDGWFYLHTYPDRDGLGGKDTLLANDFAEYLNATPRPARQVIFFGYPYLGYESIPTLPFLATEVESYVNINAPWKEAPLPPEDLNRHLTFFFLDIHTDDIADIQQDFPGGHLIERCFNGNPVWNGCYTIYEYTRQP
jgi:4-amino-4-deoxy-L-arabinose transferase-like glycosyltransferase